MKTLRCQDALVDIQYTMSGTLLALVYQSIGVIYYSTADGTPELKCALPTKYYTLFYILMLLFN